MNAKNAKKAEKKRLRAEKKAAKKKAKRAGVPAEYCPNPNLKENLEMIMALLKKLYRETRGKIGIRFRRMYISVGSDDAAKTALLCSAISIALEPLLLFIDRNSNLHGMKNADIDISPDYLSEEIKYDIKLAFSMSLGSFIYVLLRSGIPGIVGWTKIRPPSTDSSESQSKPSTDNAQNASGADAKQPTAEGKKA